MFILFRMIYDYESQYIAATHGATDGISDQFNCSGEELIDSKRHSVEQSF